jgi:hypothetical protein
MRVKDTGYGAIQVPEAGMKSCSRMGFTRQGPGAHEGIGQSMPRYSQRKYKRGKEERE